MHNCNRPGDTARRIHIMKESHPRRQSTDEHVSKKHHKPAPPTTADLKARVERTRREGRFQQAMELVKQLYKAEPTAAHLELVKDTYLQRATQLRSQGYTRDAATVLETAARLDEKNPAWLEK